MQEITGQILNKKNDKAVVLANNKYYIVSTNAKEGEKINFDSEKALIMPSLLFALAALEEDNLDETLDFIHSNWFKK